MTSKGCTHRHAVDSQDLKPGSQARRDTGPPLEGLVSNDREITCDPTLCPRTADDAIIRPEIAQLTINHVTHNSPRGFLCLGFDMDSPGRRIERDPLHRDSVGSWIDRACNGFTIPIKLEQQAMPISVALAPITAPRTFEGMAVLGRHRRREDQDREETTQTRNMGLH